MNEYVARPVYYVGVHLFFASLVWCAAWVLTRLARGSAAVKYWVWFATSLNFVLPLGAILDKSLARHLGWARPLGTIGDLGVRIADHAALVGSLWLFGAAVMAVRLGLRIRACRSGAHARTRRGPRPRPAFFVGGTPVRFTPVQSGPMVAGVLRQHISLPEGIDRLLTRAELDAVLLHEAVHARRHDNLIWLIHEVGRCLLWFHPLVWITGSRIALYRELSCDESVIESARGGDLLAALAKLANPEGGLLLQASASSFVAHRVERLCAVRPRRTSLAPNALLIAAFGGSVLAGVFETVAHTACCFVR
jgi:beta-lactamase regulating signal transducer with metallopeptidase domain